MTSATTPKTILLAGDGCHKEAAAGGTITPGMLLQRNASAAVIAHAQAGDNAIPMVALENDLVGKGITDNYASGQNVLFKVLYPGAEWYAIIADGEDIDYDDPLTSNGDGTLREAAAGEVIVARSRSLTNVAPSGSTARCPVEVVIGGFASTT